MQGVYTTSENSIKEMKLMDKIADRLLEELNCNTVFTIPIFGGIGVSESVVVTWIIMAVMILAAFILTRNLKTTHISKRQAVAEFIVTKLTDMCEEMVGPKGKQYTEYLVTVLLYIGIANIIGFRSGFVRDSLCMLLA